MALPGIYHVIGFRDAAISRRYAHVYTLRVPLEVFQLHIQWLQQLMFCQCQEHHGATPSIPVYMYIIIIHIYNTMIHKDIHWVSITTESSRGESTV